MPVFYRRWLIKRLIREQNSIKEKSEALSNNNNSSKNFKDLSKFERKMNDKFSTK